VARPLQKGGGPDTGSSHDQCGYRRPVFLIPIGRRCGRCLSFASCVWWVCPVLCYPPPPIVRIAHSIRCAGLGTTLTCCSHLAFDGCTGHHILSCLGINVVVLWWLSPSSIVCVLRSMGAGYPSAYHSRLAFDRCICGSHHLHPLSVFCVWWVCVVLATASILRSRFISMGVGCAPPPIVCISLSMGCAVTASSSTHRSRLEFAGCVSPTTLFVSRVWWRSADPTVSHLTRPPAFAFGKRVYLGSVGFRGWYWPEIGVSLY